MPHTHKMPKCRMQIACARDWVFAVYAFGCHCCLWCCRCISHRRNIILNIFAYRLSHGSFRSHGRSIVSHRIALEDIIFEIHTHTHACIRHTTTLPNV